MIGLIFQKKLISIKELHQKSMIFVIIGTFYIKILNMNHTFAMVVCKNFNDVIVFIKGSDSRIQFSLWAKMMQLA